MALTHSFNIEESVNGRRASALYPGEVAAPILKQRPVEPGDEDKALMLQEEDLYSTICFIAEQPPHVCINELVITPVLSRICSPRRSIPGTRRGALVSVQKCELHTARQAGAILRKARWPPPNPSAHRASSLKARDVNDGPTRNPTRRHE